MQLSARLRALRGRDGGFSLPEMIITIAIIGIIAAALAGVLVSYLKTTTDTQSRLTESHDVQFAAAYWQRDVASIGVRGGYDTVADKFPLEQSVDVSPACTLPTGTRVVTLAWSQYTDSDSTAPPTTITVSYVAQPDTGGYNLLRTRCTGSTIDSSVELMHSLDALPTVTCDISCTSASVPTVVSLSVSVLDPDGRGGAAYTATLTGERRQT